METQTKSRKGVGGRPPIGPELVLRLPREWTVALDALAAERRTTRAALIRLALAETYPQTVPETVDPNAPRYASRIPE